MLALQRVPRSPTFRLLYSYQCASLDPSSTLLQSIRSSAEIPSSSIMTKRYQHSSTQIKRLFKKNPATIRVLKRRGDIQEPLPIPPPQFAPILEPKFLPNGWSPPPGEDTAVPEYPFHVSRTKNKPRDAAGFLPVYSEYRYVSFFVLA